ncbi:MAG: hypothetical protein HY308_01835 [Gammaproteobacteria bacterium]|nr:hypothetical protein [Gammaproteobacteria bacterium]
MKYLARTLTSCVTVALALVALFSTVPVFARDNPNPVDWRVYEMYSAHSVPVPLRYGQHDYRDERGEEAGFGFRHIQDAHEGVIPSRAEVLETLNGDCEPDGLFEGKIICDSGYLLIAYQPNPDSRSGDAPLPLGIVTMFYHLGGCEDLLMLRTRAAANSPTAANCNIPPPSADAGPDVAGDEGAAIVVDGSVSSEIGPPAVDWSYAAGNDVPAGATCNIADPHAVATTITCSDRGTYTITLSANDGINPIVQDSAIVTVRNAPPKLRIDSPTSWQAFEARTTVSLLAPFSDASGHDVHTCDIDWDDGLTHRFAQEASCNDNHSYENAGMYTVRIRVTDVAGGTDMKEVLVVVYDPAAGMAKGNGWLDPARLVDFNFLSHYPGNHTTAPQGKVRFFDDQHQIRLLAQDTLEWLVITPNRRLAIKGKGELAPDRTVSFVLYGYDLSANGKGQTPPDQLRMVIWDDATGTTPDKAQIIYDSNAGAPFDIDLANPVPIEAGKIQVIAPHAQ